MGLAEFGRVRSFRRSPEAHIITQRLTYGGASISDLVSEMLSLADLEIQLIDKRRQLKQNILDYTSNYGISCSLTNSCNILAWSAVFNEN